MNQIMPRRNKLTGYSAPELSFGQNSDLGQVTGSRELVVYELVYSDQQG